MTAIVKRITKGSTLTVAELDANVANLNTAKLETTGGTLTGLPVLANQDVDIISPVYPTTKPSLNLDFTRGQLDPRVTFARNSTAAYYDGKTTAKAEENLLTYSQSFSSWNYSGATATSTTQLDPAGTTTALQLTKTADSPYSVYINNAISPANNTYTFSIYLKGVIGATVKLVMSNTINQDITKTITLTDVWVRYDVPGTFNSTVSGAVRTQIRMDATVTATEVYAAFAQLEQRSSVTAYTPTTTAAITNYIPVLKFAPANAPRFDYDPITGKPLGLLIEEGRTNLYAFSNSLNWTQYGSIDISLNALVAPDGTQTATLLTDTNTASYLGVSYSSPNKEAGAYTTSVYVKQGTSTSGFSIWILTPNDVTTIKYQQTISWVAGVPTAAGLTAIAVGNGWYRCSYTYTLVSSTQPINTYILPCPTSVSSTGSTAFWGAQLEAGSFATSYIPTTTGSVGRFADEVSMTGTNFSSWYNQSAGTLYSESNSLSNVNNMVANLGDNALGVEGIDLRAPFGYGAIYRVNSINNIYTDTSGIINSFYKQAISSTSFSHCYSNNGASQYTINLGQPSTISRLEIGNRFGSLLLNGHIRKLTYYPKALPSTELQALTS